MILRLFRIAFALLHRLSPRLAGRLAVSLFYAPRRFPAAKWEAQGLALGRPDFYEFDGERLEATVWGAEGNGPYVLLVHGWEGRRGQLSKIALALADVGYRVVAIDGPAHGSSKKKRTTLVEFSQAVVSATKRFGTPLAIVGHSFGAAASAIALQEQVSAERVVLISCPYSLRHVVSTFARFAGVPDQSHEAMYPLMEKLHRCTEEDLSFKTIGPVLKLPTLLIHDEQDRYISFIDGQHVHQQISSSFFHGTRQLGHMRILQDDSVIEKVAAFVTSPDAVSSARVVTLPDLQGS